MCFNVRVIPTERPKELRGIPIKLKMKSKRKSKENVILRRQESKKKMSLKSQLITNY